MQHVLCCDCAVADSSLQVGKMDDLWDTVTHCHVELGWRGKVVQQMSNGQNYGSCGFFLVGHLHAGVSKNHVKRRGNTEKPSQFE